jgi:hypothetical protein
VSDDRVRALEREHQAAPSPESLRALRREEFRAGIPPFPVELFTEEWEAVFDAPAARQIHGISCPHPKVRHSCPHATSSKAIDLRLEDVVRVGKNDVHRTTCGLRDHEVVETRIVGNLGLRDGCTLYVEAWFLSDHGIVAVTGTHSPCPLQLSPVLSIPYSALEALGRVGKDVTVNGVPQEIRPLEEFRVEFPFPLYSTSRLDGLLVRASCICGHSRANHGPEGNEGNGPCLDVCGCLEFRLERSCSRCHHSEVVHVEGGCMGEGMANGPVCRCPSLELF